ncbi:hypothetical protein DMA15_30610 [Streptomyces sp. WAC 01529]|uniref:hypothetical protein n=1 Tax=Streptomyces sp. WAC 01529 TaxID=2203205 RepID=UPI000F6CEDA3|nr:hypothetical protein [Streptomyces sp. WAC 01529]AZM56398.1 hypothetical protein DMA15_30610 [Streptomyces sp. WAC 01529]
MTHSHTPVQLHGAAARRALLNAGALLVLASITPLINAGLGLGALYDVHWSQRTFHYTALVRIGVGIVVFFWLPWLVIARTPLGRVSPRQRMLHRCAAVSCGALSLCATDPDASLGHAGTVVTGVTLAWLAVEVCRSHGVTLERASREKSPRLRNAEAYKLAKRVFAFCMIGGALSFLGVQALRWFDVDALPVMGDQLAAIGVKSPVDLLAALVVAVAVEDVVIVAATAALMTAAGRPAWQIYTTVCVIEVALHAYFGAPALGMLFFALGRLSIFLRHGRVLPLIIGHAVFDLIGGLLMPLPLHHRLLAAIPVAITIGTVEARLLKMFAEPSARGAAV